jgi:hypothetical protein
MLPLLAAVATMPDASLWSREFIFVRKASPRTQHVRFWRSGRALVRPKLFFGSPGTLCTRHMTSLVYLLMPVPSSALLGVSGAGGSSSTVGCVGAGAVAVASAAPKHVRADGKWWKRLAGCYGKYTRQRCMPMQRAVLDRHEGAPAS